MLIPIFLVRAKVRRMKDKADRTMLAGLAIMVTICAVNLLPNMALPNLQLFFAAGLSVLARNMPLQARMEQEPSKPKPEPKPKKIRDPLQAAIREKAFLQAIRPALKS
jgi:hypothetical protein